jgi:hypothetical protein
MRFFLSDIAHSQLNLFYTVAFSLLVAELHSSSQV